MRFQPGQSGNPAGRPLGSRNKKTIAMEEKFAEQAQKAVDDILLLSGGGHPVAMRICAEWVRPTGTNQALGLELPPVECADDAQAALQTVLAAFGRGEMTVRQLPVMLASVDRAVRIAERIVQLRQREWEGMRTRGETHPSMLPHPVPDPMEPIFAAIARGEDPFPDDPAPAAREANQEGLHSPVNSGEESLRPRAQASGGEGGERSEPGGGSLFAPPASVQAPPTPDPSPPRFAWGVGNREAAADKPGDGALYSPVNSGESGEEPRPGAADVAPLSPASVGGISASDGAGLYSPVNSNASAGPPAWEPMPPLPEGGLAAVLGAVWARAAAAQSGMTGRSK